MQVYLKAARNGTAPQSRDDIALVVACTNLAFNLNRPLTGAEAAIEEDRNIVKFHPFPPSEQASCAAGQAKARISQIAAAIKHAADEMEQHAH